MKRLSPLQRPIWLSLVVFSLAPFAGHAADRYWDLNGEAAGAGGPTPSGAFTDLNWNPDAGGTSTTQAFVSGDTAIFAAGTDATGEYTVTLGSGQTAAGVRVEEGTVNLAGSGLTVGAGTVQVLAGAKLSIPSTLNVVATTGAKLNLDGGTFRNTSNAAGATFVDADFTIELGAAGGTVETANTGTNSTIFTGVITGPGNTLTKTGSGEFRYNGSSTAPRTNTTFAKLVVNQGLFRLGSVSGFDTELGFGAAPAEFTPDAITLSNGGTIGASFAVTLNANRGVTLGTGGGAVTTASASFTIPGAVTGGGSLTKLGGGTTTLTLSGVNTFSGGLNHTGGDLRLNNNSAAGSGPINVNTGATRLGSSALGIEVANAIVLQAGVNPEIFGTSGNSLVLSGTISEVGGAASLARNDFGGGTITLTGANTFTGGFKITSRGIGIGNKAAFGTGPLTIGDAVTAPATPITLTATVDLSGSNAVTNSVILNQNFTTAGMSLELTSNVDLGAATRTITTNNTAPSVTTLSGVISGAGGSFTKAGAATLRLSGASSFTGATTISAGTLLLTGSLAGTSKVDITGTLGGTGSITPAAAGNINLLDGGKISPGLSAGTLSATFSSGGKLDITAGVTASNSQALIFELGTPLASDRITLTGGALEIGTGVLEFDDFVFTTLAGFVPENGVYLLFDGNTPISGVLGNNLTGDIGGGIGRLQLADGGNDLVLQMIPEPGSVALLVAGMGLLAGRRRRFIG